MGWQDSKQMSKGYVRRWPQLFYKLKNIIQSREGVSLILGLLRQSRLQPMTMGLQPNGFDSAPAFASLAPSAADDGTTENGRDGEEQSIIQKGPWSRLSSWLRPR